MKVGIAAMLVGLAISPRLASADDKAAAEEAFTRAKQLVAAGNFAEACPLFEASHRADPQIGALLNAADCHEQLGHTATAWAEFREADELATKRHDKRAAFAKQRADALVGKLAKLHVTAASLPGLVVKRDDVDVTVFVGHDVPVDPGEHVVTATAPGHTPYKTTISIGKEPTTSSVDIPALEVAPDPLSMRGTQMDYELDSSAQHSRRKLAVEIGGGGVVALAVGLGFGWHARSDYNDAHAGGTPGCDSSNICTADGRSMLDAARRDAMIANVAVGVGLAAIAAGVGVWLTAPSPVRTERMSMRVVPTLDGVAVAGRF